jgi:hypothetical protein
VDLEKLELEGVVKQYDAQMEDAYGRMDANAHYADMLRQAKEDMDAGAYPAWPIRGLGREWR